ncbi:MAG TPA: hypothetical protein VM118_07765 [Acidobacteriota bacterium]|nr:hypothetical protein [Acidobacteriota bacterium]
MRKTTPTHFGIGEKYALAAGPLLAVLLAVGLAGCTDERPVDPLPEPPDTVYVTNGADMLPAWSPDGRTVAYWAFLEGPDVFSYEQYLQTVDVETGKIDTVRDMAHLAPFNTAWGPDGRWLLLSTASGIVKILTTGDSLTLLKAGEFHVSATWSRVSDRIFFGINGGSEGGVYSMGPDGTGLRRWTYPASCDLAIPTVFPDSDTLAAMGWEEKNSYCLVLYYPRDTCVISKLRCGLLSFQEIRMSPNHRFVGFTSNIDHPLRSSLYAYDRETDTILTLVPTRTEGYDFSPDGHYVVYLDHEITDGLQILEIATGQVRQLTPGYVVDTSWDGASGGFGVSKP